MLTNAIQLELFILERSKKPLEATFLTTTTRSKNTMELPPLPIPVTLNQTGTGAILHINCQSDGQVARWMVDKEESDGWAKQVWLGKLGCLLKLHGNIKC